MEGEENIDATRVSQNSGTGWILPDKQRRNLS